MSRLLMIAFLVGTSAAAQTYVQDHRGKIQLVKTPEWTAYRLLQDDGVRLRFETEKARVEYRPPIPSSQLLTAKRAEWGGRAYLITYWQEGVSTTALRVFDPGSGGLKVYEKYSMGDVLYVITPTGLRITIGEDDQNPLSPNAVTENWEAP